MSNPNNPRDLPPLPPVEPPAPVAVVVVVEEPNPLEAIFPPPPTPAPEPPAADPAAPSRPDVAAPGSASLHPPVRCLVAGELMLHGIPHRVKKYDVHRGDMAAAVQAQMKAGTEWQVFPPPEAG